jgi:D-lyxose ketol-isomerase
MITREQYDSVVDRASQMLAEHGIAITDHERANFEVADFGLSDLDHTGLEIIVYMNTDRCCAKELVMFPGQTCPEHLHPTIDGVPGKEETFRCRWGTVYLYMQGERTGTPACSPPPGSEQYYTVFREVCLKEGEQFTMYPDTLHWFQAGPEGAIVSEFSTRSRDELDRFTDPRIQRETEIVASSHQGA